MKNLATLLLTASILVPTMAQATQTLNKTCLTSAPESNYPFYISVETVIDEETGLTKEIHASTTYDSKIYCMDALKGKLSKPEIQSPREELISQKSCYADLSNQVVFYLVNEKIDPKTGLIVELEVKNEFDSFGACKSNL